MLWSEYQEEVKSDAMECIKENLEYSDSWDEMYDILFMDDSVTGNVSGSYYCNSYKAAEAISGIIFDSNVVDEFKEMGYDGIPTEEGAETCDVIARCICLGLVSGELEEYYDSLREDEDEDEEEEDEEEGYTSPLTKADFINAADNLKAILNS